MPATRSCAVRLCHAKLEDDKVKGYLVSLAVGVLVGLIYNLLSVKSPAPPTIALVGLFGMLIGEHAVTFVRHVVTQLAG